jgi:hypothetical protein
MSIDKGFELPPLTVRITRADLVRYAGASLDFNPIHYNDRVAKEVGLPDVIAHGMYTMAQGARLVTNYLGDPGKLLSYGVRFTRPVVVPNNENGAMVEFTGKVTAVDEDSYTITVTAKFDGQTILGAARAKVRL